MSDVHDAVMLLHTPLGDYARLARVCPDFPSREAACAFLQTVARPHDYKVSFIVDRKPRLLRGDRFLAQCATTRRQTKARGLPHA